MFIFVQLTLYYNTPKGLNCSDSYSSSNLCPLSHCLFPLLLPSVYTRSSQWSFTHQIKWMAVSWIRNITIPSDSYVMCCERGSIFVWDVQKIEREHSNHLSWLAWHLKTFFFPNYESSYFSRAAWDEKQIFNSSLFSQFKPSHIKQ